MPADNQDRKLKALLAQLLVLIKTNGSRSEEVKNYIQRYIEVEEFPELAATCIFMAEHDDEQGSIEATG